MHVYVLFVPGMVLIHCGTVRRVSSFALCIMARQQPSPGTFTPGSPSSVFVQAVDATWYLTLHIPNAVVCT